MPPLTATDAPVAAATADDGHIFQPLHRDAEMAGGRLAERQRVEAARQERHRGQRQHDDRRDGSRSSARSRRPASRAPEGQVAQLPVVGHEDQDAGQRHGQRASAMPASSMVATEVRPCLVATR